MGDRCAAEVTGGRFLVPVMVEAVRVSRTNEDWKKTGLVTPNYSELEYTILGGNLEREPFTSQSPLEKGVHLHFILPDALTRGVEKDGSFVYPDIPDRWLITRIERDSCNPQELSVRQTSWVVEGNYIGTDNTASVRIPTLDDEKRRYKYLGRTYCSGEEKKGNGGYLEHLTVFGNGDPAFSAYYPACRSVLGYYDDLAGVEPGKLMYLVLGWYDDPKKDPLWGATRENWSQYMEKLSWKAEIPESSPVPEKILCHSAALCIDWRGEDYNYPSDAPEGEVELTLGNTSAEALSALIARKTAKDRDAALPLERFLNALQYDVLEEYNEQDGISKVEDAIQQRFFSGENCGSTWGVRGKETDNTGTKQELTKEASMFLYELNALQCEEDRLTAVLQSQREKLYGIFYRYFRKYEEPPAADIPPDRNDMMQAFLHMETEAGRTGEALKKAAQLREEKQKALETYLAQKLPEFYAEKKADRICYRAAEPVLLLSGDGIKRSYAFGSDGRFEDDGRLLCRLTEQCVDSLSVNAEGTEIAITAEKLFSILPSLPEPPEIDDVWKVLLFEGLLMDTASAGLLAAAACRIAGKPCDEERISRLEKQIKEQILAPYAAGNCQDDAVQRAGEEAGYHGVMPSVISLNYTDGEWNSLYLEWEACFYSAKTNEQQDDSLDGWRFGGIDYQYEKEIPEPSRLPFYRGRTVITPHPQLVLADILNRQADNYKENPDLYEKLKEIRKLLADLNILAQSMGGLTDMLTGRKYGLQFPVMITAKELMQDENAIYMVKSLNSLQEAPEGYTPVWEEGFFPIRAGFLKISRLRILSTFGFSQTIFTDKNRLWVSENMDAGSRMENAAMLPPRISQSSYLSYEWHPVLEKDSSPVCGYLIPNYVNKGLMIYDVDGTMLGSLQLHYEKNGKTRAMWAAAPLSSQTGFEDTVFSNVWLKEMVRAMLRVSQQKEGTFAEFLGFLDERQSNILVEGNSCGEDLSVLWGRPLVLARADMALRLKGEPHYRQWTDDMEAYVSDGLENVPFSIYLGDALRTGDGLVGWYKEKEGSRTFEQIYAPEGAQPAGKTAGYVEYDKPLTLTLQKEDEAHIWMIMEPEGTVTLRSGILPAQQIALPAFCCREALEQMYLAMEAYPVVSPEEAPAVLCPEDETGTWSYVCREGASYIEYGNLSAQADVFSQKKQTLMDGYLMRKKKS